jgi:hypothetical protein
MDEELQANGVGGVMRAIAAVLVDRGHDENVVTEGLAENAGHIEGELWDRFFGPAADEVAIALGLAPYPQED